MIFVHLQEKTQFTVEKVQASYVVLLYPLLVTIIMLIINDCNKLLLN